MCLKQQNTTACLMRDKLIEKRFKKEITLKQITDGLIKQDLPKWLQAQIIEMTNFNLTKRITCPVEQAMEAAVHSIIIEEIS